MELAELLHRSQVGDELRLLAPLLQGTTVRAEVCRSYNDEVQAALQSSVWNSGGCTSYFIDRNGRNSTNWPWSASRLRQRLRRFRLRDYELQTGA